MSIPEVIPERFAQLFHHYHRALAQETGYARSSIFQAWEQMPVEEKRHMVAAARLALEELAASAKKAEKRYFAEPGKAEWGC